MRSSEARRVGREHAAGLVLLAATGVAVFSAFAVAGIGNNPWIVAGCALGIGISMLALAVLVTALNRDRTTTSSMLERVYDAMRAVSANPELVPTLQTIADGASEAVGATFTAIVLRDADEMYLYAVSGTTNRRERFVPPDGSPLEYALETGELVVLNRGDADPRFGSWLEVMRPVLTRAGIECGVAIPLRVGDAIVGVLGAQWTAAGAANPANVALLSAYADQAAIVIVRSQAFERERELLRRLFEADQLKSEFLAHVSHELRTPLTAAKGFVDTLLAQWPSLSEEQRVEMLVRASANADDLARLIDTLLEYSRLESSEMRFDFVDAALAPMVHDVVRGLGPALGDCEIEVDVPDAIGVRVDRHAFAHLLTNLLTNAAKVSPAGAVVRVSAACEDGEVLVFVTDEGPGIALDDQERIFERFVRISPEPGARGTGLGLAIARRCAEALGGRIWVESEPGAGATFAVALPEQRPADHGLTRSPPAAKLDQPV